MYVVTVEFIAKGGCEDRFRRYMVANARSSRELEPGCLQFDVAIDPADPATIFLYEIYTGKEAFDEHVASAHFREFNEATQDLVARKTVRVFTRIDPA
jgi:quinol monooxygenase YgiN